MADFNPLTSLVGGVLIGLSATLLLATLGRVAGITGITVGVLRPTRGDLAWRVAFLLGLVGGGALLWALMPSSFAVNIERAPGVMILAGLLVGVGARLGGGCTSGHGVCGLSRLSGRSLVAVLTFMLTGAISVFLTRWLTGGV